MEEKEGKKKKIEEVEKEELKEENSNTYTNNSTDRLQEPTNEYDNKGYIECSLATNQQTLGNRGTIQFHTYPNLCHADRQQSTVHVSNSCRLPGLK